MLLLISISDHRTPSPLNFFITCKKGWFSFLLRTSFGPYPHFLVLTLWGSFNLLNLSFKHLITFLSKKFMVNFQCKGYRLFLWLLVCLINSRISWRLQDVTEVIQVISKNIWNFFKFSFGLLVWLHSKVVWYEVFHWNKYHNFKRTV